MIKSELDQYIRRMYYLTEAIIEMDSIIKLNKNSRLLTILGETVHEYDIVCRKTRKLIDKYISEEVAKGNPIPIDYKRIYKKLGDRDETSKNS